VDEARLRALLDQVRAGACSDDAFVDAMRSLPEEDLGFARLDHHRHLRTGFPEVIFGQGKTAEQVAAIFARLRDRHPVVMATRVNAEQVAAVWAVEPASIHHEAARIITWHRGGRQFRHADPPLIAVVAAGTADLPVAEEAAVTAETIGWPVDRLYDVGVAGLHRLLALASVVGGLVKAPVIAVPTSVGYGANFGGLSALLCMLNSCATGITVVNIDNGFGAGYNAALLAEMACAPSPLDREADTPSPAEPVSPLP
jgi:hypothetical protein